MSNIIDAVRNTRKPRNPDYIIHPRVGGALVEEYFDPVVEELKERKDNQETYLNILALGSIRDVSLRGSDYKYTGKEQQYKNELDQIINMASQEYGGDSGLAFDFDEYEYTNEDYLENEYPEQEVARLIGKAGPRSS